MKIGFEKINENINLYLKNDKSNEVLLFEIFIHNIILRGRETLCKSFYAEMKKEFEISMFCKFKFFVGLQVCQMKFGIFISQTKYIKEILKTFGIEDWRPVRTTMSIGHKLSKTDDVVDVN